MVQTESRDAAGTRTVVSRSYDASGQIASVLTTLSSADGRSVTNSHDDSRHMRRAA